MFWTPRLCRICATVGTTTYPLFSDSRQDIETKFEKCFKIIAYKDDFKPKEICNTCIQKLEEFCAFVDMCTASNDKFESILYETNRSEVQENWENRIDYKLSTNVFSQTSAESGVIVKADNIALQISAEAPIDIFETTPNNQTVLRHSSEFYHAPDNNKSDSVVEFDAFSFDYQKKNEIEDKKVNQRDAVIKKCECGKGFNKKSLYNDHLASHSKIRPFTCEICNKTFPLRWNLTRHKKVHTTIHQCEYCAKTFSSDSKLQRHVRIHTNEKPFKCTFQNCGCSFSDKRNLVAHQARHSNERKFACDVCKKCFKTKGQLNDHRKGHTERSFECEICSKCFKWRTNVLKHMKKHSEFHCKKCKVDFRNRSMFLMHREECSMFVQENCLHFKNDNV